jgi:nitroimidazol reductase NimA-like FMN-containing flavoprotein (pyridoxamine 5'-phosphate oxidase superfamily)
MPICSVGYVFEGAPFVTPTLQWREGSRVYWHGSSASRMLRACEEAQVCLTVSIIDGFVMARSAFNHSCNYRSLMVFGTAQKVTDADEKVARLKAFTEGLWPGRWDMLRPLTKKEIKATTVLSMALDESSAKIRSGPPGDDEEDYALPVWAGVIPVKQQVMAPIDDPRLLPGLKAPSHITDFKIG